MKRILLFIFGLCLFLISDIFAQGKFKADANFRQRFEIDGKSFTDNT